MYLKKEKRSVWKLVGIFFAAMILFTLLSRAAYQHGVAVVSTKAPSSGAIAHTVQLTGKAVQNQEQAVTTEAGLRVARVLVNEGQQVAKGDALFTLDLDYLERTILTQKQNMEKQRLSIQDAWSQSASTQQRQSNSLAQAQESYHSAVSQAQTALHRAARNLERAETALENYYQGTAQDHTVEQALELDCQETKEAYAAAAAALEQLQLEIEEAIQQAIADAESQNTLPPAPLPDPLPDPLPEIQPLTQEELDAIADAVRSTYAQRLFDAQFDLQQAELAMDAANAALEIYYCSGIEDPAQEEILIFECQEAQSDYEKAEDALEQLQWELEAEIQAAISLAESQSQEVLLPIETLPPVETLPTAEPEPLTPEEQEAIAESVRQEYAQRLSDAQAYLTQTQQAVSAAEAALEAYRQEQQSGKVYSEQELLDALERAQDAYDDAQAALENTETTYSRAIRSASLPNASSSSGQVGQITYDQMALTLNALEALLDGEGKILAPVDGIVLRCNVQVGEKTSDTTAILLADLGQGCKFSGSLTQEQSAYIGVGDLVTLRASSTGKQYEKLPVTTVSGTDSGCQLTVQLPANTLPHGASAELTFTRKSQAYACCVPVAALHLDARNQPYVLVVEPVDSVLGTQLQARKVSVTVLEKNETMAALAQGSLSSSQQVIVGSDRAVDSGSRVRVN